MLLQTDAVYITLNFELFVTAFAAHNIFINDYHYAPTIHADSDSAVYYRNFLDEILFGHFLYLKKKGRFTPKWSEASMRSFHAFPSDP